MAVKTIIAVAGEPPTGSEMAAALTETLGREVRSHAIEPGDYRRLDFPGAEDLGNMFEFQLRFNEMFCRARSVAASRELNPELQGGKDWLAANRTRTPIA